MRISQSDDDKKNLLARGNLEQDPAGLEPSAYCR